MKILFIELCNFNDYPTGGHLSFALHMLSAFGNELKLVGINTEPEFNKDKGKWARRIINGVEYDYFSIANVEKISKRPFIPVRISSFIYLKRYFNKIKDTKFDHILIQTPEVLFALPSKLLNKACLIMPGVSNPLSISRYKAARNLTSLFDFFFFRRASKVQIILPAADNEAIDGFIKRSNGKIDKNIVKQFPTRYDASIFHLKNKEYLRKKYNRPIDVNIFITVGRLNWFKGWKFMIDSFDLLNEPNSILYFIGDGEDEFKIKEYIRQKNIDNKVFLLGRQNLDFISDYLNMSDVFIMGSYREGWSTSLVEAVACGIPSVVTSFSSAKDLVIDNINGYVLNDRDEEKFAINMHKALNLKKENIMKQVSEISKLSVQKMKEQFLGITNWK